MALSSKRPMPKRPDPSLIGEPGEISKCLHRMLEALEDARRWSRFAAHSGGGSSEKSIVDARLEVIDPILDTFENVVSELAKDVRISEIQALNGIEALEASQLLNAEKRWRETEAAELPRMVDQSKHILV